MLSTLSLTALFFVISGIQYWITNYFVQVLDVNERDTNIYFALTCITSPILGALASGKISHSFGGYESPKAIPTCIFYGLIAIAASLPFPFVNDYRICILLIWIVLFCGALILPILTGIMLSSVEPELRPQANSLSNLSYNLLGYLPAPTIYGFAQNMTEGKKSRYGVAILFYMTIFPVMF